MRRRVPALPSASMTLAEFPVNESVSGCAGMPIRVRRGESNAE